MYVLNTILLQAQSSAGSGWSGMLMIVAMIAIFYFVMIRPQSKKQKELKKQREAMQSGDKVVTAGGIHGRIKELRRVPTRCLWKSLPALPSRLTVLRSIRLSRLLRPRNETLTDDRIGKDARLAFPDCKIRGFHNALVFLIFVVIATVFWIVITLNDSVTDTFRVKFRVDNVPDSVTFITDPSA